MNRIKKEMSSRIDRIIHPDNRANPFGGWSTDSQPRVLFVSGTPGAPMRYRVLNQVEQLKFQNIAYAYGLDDEYAMLQAVQECDMLYLYRARPIPNVFQLIKLAKRRNVPVAFDTDDIIWDERLIEYCALEAKYGVAATAEFQQFFLRTESLMRHANYFIASTSFLADALREHFDRPVYINENALSQHALTLSEYQYTQRKLTQRSSVRIGYFSGWPKTHEEDFAIAAPALIRVLRDYPQVHLRIVGHFDIDSLPTALHNRIEVMPFVEWERLFEQVAEVDINIAPIIDNPHRRSKSAVKFLEAALVGVPTVASRLNPYTEIIDGVTGHLAQTTDEWYAALSELIQDASLRERIGTRAREYVLANHTTMHRSVFFSGILEEIHAVHKSSNPQDLIIDQSISVEYQHRGDRMNNSYVTIIIRARDEEASLRKLLPLLRNQKVEFDFEILILDNDSVDDTKDLAKEYNVRYHRIPRNGFNYSSALNTGAELANGDILVNISAHCFPQSEYWLAHLIHPLKHNDRVVGTYGRQWTNPWTNPFEAMGNDSLFPGPGLPVGVLAFSNANSAVRRQAVLMHPFNPAIKILEDHLFYLELSEDYLFEYAPEALVNHEHDEFSWRYYIRRWLREGWAYFFLEKHRGYKSPFVNRPFLKLKNLLYHYPRHARAFAKGGRRRVGLLTIPFFYLRDTIWTVGFRWAQLCHSRMSQEDSAFLLATKRHALAHMQVESKE